MKCLINMVTEDVHFFNPDKYRSEKREPCEDGHVSQLRSVGL